MNAMSLFAGRRQGERNAMAQGAPRRIFPIPEHVPADSDFDSGLFQAPPHPATRDLNFDRIEVDPEALDLVRWRRSGFHAYPGAY